MSEHENREEEKTTSQPGACWCPFCFSRRVVEEKTQQYKDFFTHLRNARIEVLRALKSLLEERISSLEHEKKKVTKVQVE